MVQNRVRVRVGVRVVNLLLFYFRQGNLGRLLAYSSMFEVSLRVKICGSRRLGLGLGLGLGLELRIGLEFGLALAFRFRVRVRVRVRVKDRVKDRG